MSQKEINIILQKKLASVTRVHPKTVEEQTEPSDTSPEIVNNVDIHYAVKPFYNILILFGMQKLNFDDEVKVVSYKVKIYAGLIAIAMLGIQSYNIYVKFITIYPDRTPASVITDLLTVIPLTISTVISLIMAVTCNRGMILRTLNNFVIVDKQLSIQNQNVYKPLRTKIVAVVGLMLIGTIVQYVYDYMSNMFNLEYFSRVFTFVIKELVILEIVLLIYVDITRLEAMNVQLENTKYEINKWFNEEVYNNRQKADTIMMRFSNKVGGFVKDQADEEKVDDLIRLMRIYDRLADNANIVNSCFGIPLLCSAIAVFINILSTVDKLITMTNKTKSSDTENDLVVGSIISWCIRDLIFVILVTVICERLQSKVKNTTDIINKLSISSRIDANKQELLERFSQLIACRRFTLTACNFFPFDFTFIYSLVGAVATYTVILLQVSQPPAPTKKPN